MKEVSSNKKVKDYWESHPLLYFELGNVSTSDRWHKLDEVKRSDVERFAMPFWGFERVKGKKVLDIGCGPGWQTVNYAKNQARVFAVDLTESAVLLTKRALEENFVSAIAQVASADQLPFDDETFDKVVASGVLHHVPDYQTAFREAYRVTRDGGIGLITLYRLGAMHHPMLFPFVKVLMRLTGTRHPGSNLAVTGRTVADFIRQYDGINNPTGIAKTEREWETDLVNAGWKIVSVERHFFPLRMSRWLRGSPRIVHKALDRYLSTMVYFTLER